MASELKSDVALLKTSINDNALVTAKLVSDLAQMKSDLSLSASAASTAAVILPPSSSPSAHTTITPTINDIAIELNLRERKKLNVVVFGLPPGPDDKQAFEDLVQNELGIKPHITKSSRLGKGTGGNSPPLLICLRDETDKQTLLSNAKKLGSSTNPAVKDKVYINREFTLQERQHQLALRNELKLRRAAGTKDISIRAGKIISMAKKL